MGAESTRRFDLALGGGGGGGGAGRPDQGVAGRVGSAVRPGLGGGSGGPGVAGAPGWLGEARWRRAIPAESAQRESSSLLSFFLGLAAGGRRRTAMEGDSGRRPWFRKGARTCEGGGEGGTAVLERGRLAGRWTEGGEGRAAVLEAEGAAVSFEVVGGGGTAGSVEEGFQPGWRRGVRATSGRAMSVE